MVGVDLAKGRGTNRDSLWATALLSPTYQSFRCLAPILDQCRRKSELLSECHILSDVLWIFLSLRERIHSRNKLAFHLTLLRFGFASIVQSTVSGDCKM